MIAGKPGNVAAYPIEQIPHPSIGCEGGIFRDIAAEHQSVRSQGSNRRQQALQIGIGVFRPGSWRRGLRTGGNLRAGRA